MTILLKVQNLTKVYKAKNGTFTTAIGPISLQIKKGETLGLVGESGSGKSTLMRCLSQLEKSSSGAIFWKQKNCATLCQEELFAFKKAVQMVFQNSSGALNPFMTVKENIAEPLKIHQVADKETISLKVNSLLASVGLDQKLATCYPFELSGGQKQRVCIARAVALQPELLIFDEPTSALDLSIQGQIINLLQKLKKKQRLTYLFASHDFPLVCYLCDRIAVMHQGQIVEIAMTKQLLASPQHPYTRFLLSQIRTR